jgi:hypothetical protein
LLWVIRQHTASTIVESKQEPADYRVLRQAAYQQAEKDHPDLQGRAVPDKPIFVMQKASSIRIQSPIF